MAVTAPDPAIRALALATAAARQAGLDVGGAEVLRVRSSVHVQFPQTDVVARVEATGRQDVARRQVLVASALSAHEAPVARLVRPEIQPILIADGAVTLWHRVQPVATPSFACLGRALRAIHGVTVASLPECLPTIDPFDAVRDCLDRPSPWSGTAALRELRARCESLAMMWPEATRNDPLGEVVVHGDVQIDNAVVVDGGDVVLLDLECGGVGPASWDFAAMALGVERYGLSPAALDEFVTGYGADPRGLPGLRMMCRVYELYVTTWAMRCSATSRIMAREAAVRVAGVLEGDSTQWTLV